MTNFVHKYPLMSWLSIFIWIQCRLHWFSFNRCYASNLIIYIASLRKTLKQPNKKDIHKQKGQPMIQRRQDSLMLEKRWTCKKGLKIVDYNESSEKSVSNCGDNRIWSTNHVHMLRKLCKRIVSVRLFLHNYSIWIIEAVLQSILFWKI